MAECEICETVDADRPRCKVLRYGIDGAYSDITGKYSWGCTCKLGRRLESQGFDRLRGDDLISEMVLSSGRKYCDHLLPLIVMYEVKRYEVMPWIKNGVEFICRSLPIEQANRVRNIYVSNEDLYEKIDSEFKSN